MDTVAVVVGGIAGVLLLIAVLATAARRLFPDDPDDPWQCRDRCRGDDE